MTAVCWFCHGAKTVRRYVPRLRRLAHVPCPKCGGSGRTVPVGPPDVMHDPCGDPLTAAQQIEQLDELRAAVEDLREANPFELHLLDARIDEHKAQIIDLQARRDALFGWAPGTEGDWAIALELARWMGEDPSRSWSRSRTEGWVADNPGPFTQQQMEAIYGPQWRFVVELVRKAASLTDAERSAYRDAWRADYDADRTGWDAAYWAVIVYAGPGVAALRALLAFVGFVNGAVVGAALARRHEVAASDYDRLTGPWRRLVGPIHPDDETLS